MDSIQGYVRMNWTMNEFFANNGLDNFINKLSSVLDIDPSRIKVAGVRQGSVIIDLVIDSSNPLDVATTSSSIFVTTSSASTTSMGSLSLKMSNAV